MVARRIQIRRTGPKGQWTDASRSRKSSRPMPASFGTRILNGPIAFGMGTGFAEMTGVDPTKARHTPPLRTRGTFITALALARYESHHVSGVPRDARVGYARSLPARHPHQPGKENPID